MKRELRDSSFSLAEVEAVNGTSSLIDRRRFERISTREVGPAMIALTEDIREPLNITEARRSKQWPHSCRAVNEELDALAKNDTFELVEAPENELILDNTV
jgi:hypothetical protein